MINDGGSRAPGRGLSFKGQFYTYTKRGTQVVAKWPRARGKNVSAATKEQNEWFRQANLMCKYTAPEQQITAMRATKGTPLLPRDIMVMNFAGRLFMADIQGIGKVYSVVARSDVSESLDVLGDTAGAVLARGTQYWQNVAPGNPGDVLVSAGPGVLPAFAPFGASGGGAVAKSNFSGISGSAYASKGLAITPAVTIVVRDFVTIINTVAGAQYQACIIKYSGTITGAVIQRSAIVSPGAGTGTQVNFEFPGATIEAGQPVLLLVSRIDGSDTYALPMSFGSGQGTGWPTLGDIQPARIAKAVPDGLQGVSLPGGDPFSLMVVFGAT